MKPLTDLTTLRVIVAAADLGSISGASNSLNLAVAAASARISAMEESLGFQIFERSSRGVQPTIAGQMLVKRARELSTSADRLAMDLHDYSLGLRGHVRMLANTSAMLEVLPALLEKFMHSHPLIRIDLEEQSSPEISLGLFEGRADIGIVDLPHRSAGLDFIDFFTDTLVLITPRHHRLSGRKKLRFKDALDEDFITLSSGTALSNRLLAAGAEAGQPLKVRMQMRGFDAVCRMVAAGLGVAVLPLEAVAPQRAFLPIATVALTDAWALRTHRIATRSGVKPSPATKTLLAALAIKTRSGLSGTGAP